MKCKVQLYVAGQVFDEIVHAANYDEQRKLPLLATLMQLSWVLPQYLVDGKIPETLY